MEWTPTSENPLQTVARRVGVAAEEKGRKREIATGAVRSIEGIIMVRVRGKVRVKVKDKGRVHLLGQGLLHCMWLALSSCPLLRSGRTHAESIGPGTNLTALMMWSAECVGRPSSAVLYSSNSPYAILKDRG